MASDLHIDNVGSLTTITGPMRSGKTEKLKSYLVMHSIAKHRTLLINSSRDVRDGVTINGVLTSHNKYGNGIPKDVNQIRVSRLHDVTTADVFRHDVIAIDEAQFFDDLELVLEWLLKYHKTLYVSGLKSTDKGTLFGKMYLIDGFVKKEHRLTALCTVCQHEFNHPSFFFPATMVKCLVNKDGDVLVGADNYISVCLRHWQMDLESINSILEL